jgi:hypothetical protein
VSTRDRDAREKGSEATQNAAPHVLAAHPTGGQGANPAALAQEHAADMVDELVKLAKTSKRATVRLQAARTILELANTASAADGGGSGGLRVIVVTQSEAEAAANMLAQRKALTP